MRMRALHVRRSRDNTARTLDSTQEKIMSKYSKTPDAISKLSPEQYRVTQESGTEQPGTGEYLLSRPSMVESRSGSMTGNA